MLEPVGAGSRRLEQLAKFIAGNAANSTSAATTQVLDKISLGDIFGAIAGMLIGRLLGGGWLNAIAVALACGVYGSL